MNMTILIAGLLSSFITIGHFVFGISWYLKPMLSADFEIVPKATMQSAFHYISVFMILSSIILTLIGFNEIPLKESVLVVKFIGLNFILFTLVQIFYSIKNKIQKPLISMFQWTLFLPVGILCLI